MTAHTPRVCVACAGLHRVDAFTATERLLGTLEQFECWPRMQRAAPASRRRRDAVRSRSTPMHIGVARLLLGVL
jgi:hypothetical protein